MGRLVRDEFDDEKWLSDPALKLCKLQTRGFWMDVICNMRMAGGEGRLTGTVLELSVLCRCSPAQCRDAISDLDFRKAADVFGDVTRNAHGEITIGNGDVTLINRRINRIFLDRKVIRDKVQRYRDRKNGRDCNRDVTDDVTVLKPGDSPPLPASPSVSSPIPLSLTPSPSPPHPSRRRAAVVKSKTQQRAEEMAAFLGNKK